MKVLVTGAAGFIGYHICKRLSAHPDCEVLGIDNLNDYYDVALKRARLAELDAQQAARAGNPAVSSASAIAATPTNSSAGTHFRFVQADFAEGDMLLKLWAHFRPDYVVHLGAQANVRYSVTHPEAYVQSNLVGFFKVLEAARAHPPKHTVFASSSSVYGTSAAIPFAEDGDTSHPLSFYGATKKANEAMAHSYAHLHGLALTGLRFFNVYGPWGRPDTAPTLFAKAIFAGEPIKLFAEGRARRDFTYIDDICDGVLKLLLYPPLKPPVPPFRMFNIGHHRPVETLLFVQMLEQLIGRKARLELLPAQPADVPETCASLDRIHAAVGYAPRVPLEDGLRQFVDWFRQYYQPE
ncbi:UDP-glucuronate 5-epimerase [Cephaloticoccus primus]|uniref:UDP-glucuronate 5-epimerase n=1 Tax=Cephaloticoccus primus TaxID=1548207 RepID=A0A139SHX1_9BACT|nr:NAD-dependent epimerase/dehydratase family protein [Cephaloticoccus primus]KXU34121.1 UDP-glucuronate 5-epimerase [Cephaloticoccus primus]